MRIYRPQSNRKIIRLKPRKATAVTAGGALVKVLTTRPTTRLSQVKPIRFSFR